MTWPQQLPSVGADPSPMPPSQQGAGHSAGISDKGKDVLKKTILGAAAAVVLTAAGVTAAVALPAAAASSDHSQTIHLTAKQTQATLLVLAAPGHGPVGNQLLTTDDVYRHARKVGHDATVCQVMADLGQAGARFQCVATVSLPEGQLTVQGLATLTETGNQPFTLAITGGTGAYRTAHGQARVTPVSQTVQHYTITVIR